MQELRGFLEVTLNDFSDSVGLVYDNGITTENTVSLTCSVLYKVGEKCDVTIPDYVYSGKFITSVTEIADMAFTDSDLIDSVTVGDLLERIGDYAFKNSSVSSFVVDKTNSTVKTLGQEAFASCASLVGEVIIPDGVSDIGKNLLSGTRPSGIYIGASLVDIPEYPLSSSVAGGEERSGDISLHIFGIQKESRNPVMKYSVSADNPRFSADSYGVLYENMIIPFDSGDIKTEVAVIDAPMSVNYSEYTVPTHVVKIAPYAFAYNTTLKSISLDYVMNVSSHAFYAASALETVHFGEPTVSDDEYVTILEEKVEKGEIKSSYIIDTMAFAKCTSLQNVNLDSPFIIKIGESAFADCGQGIKTVSLGCNIQVIEQNAFGSRTGGTDATATQWFEVKESNVGKENEYYKSIDGVLYRYLSDGSLSLFLYPINKVTEKDGDEFQKSFGTPLVDDKGNSISVTQIEAGAFSYVSKLEHVTADYVSVIGSGAFANSNLHTVFLGESVAYLGGKIDDSSHEVFAGCGYLNAIHVG